jgi:hypothetical protein
MVFQPMLSDKAFPLTMTLISSNWIDRISLLANGVVISGMLIKGNMNESMVIANSAYRLKWKKVSFLSNPQKGR